MNKKQLAQMKIYFISITIILFIVSPVMVIAQQTGVKIIDIGANNCLVGEDTLKYSELEYLFPNLSTERNVYNKNVKSLQTGKTLGYISLSSIAVGWLLIAVDNNEGAGLASSGDVIGILLNALVAPITGTIALITHFGAKEKKKQIINGYNDNITSTEHNSKYKIEIGAARQGIGLGITLSF